MGEVMGTLSNHEKYLAGEPLNDELAAIKAGQVPDFGIGLAGLIAAKADEPSLMNPDRELSRDERIALREVRFGPGWPVLQRLLEKSTIAHTKMAIALSQENPLGSGAELNQMWLTVKLWKQTITELNYAVAVEMQAIEEDMKSETKSTVERP
jgi:hypothetical protein